MLFSADPFRGISVATRRLVSLPKFLAKGLLVLSFLALSIGHVDAQSTWSGNGGNVNWSTAGNWNSVPADSTATNVIFAGTNNTGTAGTPLNQNISGTLTLNTLTFSGGAGQFFLGGGNLEFTGSSHTITQNSDSNQSIANNIVVDPGSNNQTWNLTLDGNGTGVVTLSGVLSSGNGQRDYALTKNGNTTYVLSGANTYDAGTTVNFGALYVNNTSGSGTGTGSVTVNGGTLGGSGTASGAVSLGAGSSLSPGAFGAASTAIFHTGNLTLSSSSVFVLDLNGSVVGSGYDQVSVTGTVNINGAILSLNPSNSLNVGDTFYIVANNGVDAVTGTFSQGASITSGNEVFSINYAANFGGVGAGNDISLTLIAVLPEASTWISGFVAVAIAIGHGFTVRAHRRRQLQKK
jgi:fibronectin-binding autotransporter adhesin